MQKRIAEASRTQHTDNSKWSHMCVHVHTYVPRTHTSALYPLEDVHNMLHPAGSTHISQGLSHARTRADQHICLMGTTVSTGYINVDSKIIEQFNSQGSDVTAVMSLGNRFAPPAMRSSTRSPPIGLRRAVEQSNRRNNDLFRLLLSQAVSFSSYLFLS